MAINFTSDANNIGEISHLKHKYMLWGPEQF